MEFDVRMAVNTWAVVFWGIIPYSLVEYYQRFRGVFCLHLQVTLQ
jgi:hypothetical protein